MLEEYKSSTRPLVSQQQRKVGIEPARVTARAAKPSYFNSAVAVEMYRIENVSVARMLAPLCLCVFTSACV